METERRLIDANWILGEIEHDLGCYEIEKIKQEDGLYVELRDVVKMVCAAPTVDAVEVVRCKDCKHYMTIHCTCDGCCISDDWYCADGERRTDG